jgi:hypothetical protein
MPPWENDQPSRSFRAGENLKHALIVENFLSTTSNYVFTRTAWERNGPFRPLRYTHDWDFALRIARDFDLVLIAEPLMQYRIHATNTIRENQAAMIFELCWCMALHIPVLASDELKHSASFTSQLLHSIHEHGCQPVLAALMAQLTLSDAEARETQALRLLDAGNPIRRACIEYIESRLSAQTAVPIAGWLARMRSRLIRAAHAIKPS